MENAIELEPEAQAAAAPARPDRNGNAFYDQRFDIAAAPGVASRYIFFSSQRTGSNYLCRRLCNVRDRFGLPSEYLNANAIKIVAPRLAGAAAGDARALKLGQYLRGLERIRTTADGCFGIKVQPRQLLARLPRGDGWAVRFLQRFDHIIVLTRRDKLAQAVSGSIAEATGAWVSDGNDPDLTEEALAKLCPDVALKLDRYIREELLMVDAAARSGRPTVHIDYEEILASPDTAFDAVLSFLGEPRGAAGVEETGMVPVPQKAPGVPAQRLKQHFLEFITGAGRYAGPRQAPLSARSRTATGSG